MTTATPAEAPTRLALNLNFFSLSALALFIIVNAGFIGNWIVNYERIQPFTLPIILHLIFNGGWYVLLVAQTMFIATGNFALHQRIGQLSALVVLAMLASGMWMVLERYYELMAQPENSRATQIISASVWQWVTFLVFYCTAIAKRHSNSGLHKRYMIYSGVAMLGPGASRLIGLIGAEGTMRPLASIAVLYAIPIAMLVYDWRTTRRIHLGSWTGLILFSLLIASFFTIGPSAWMSEMVKAVFGR